MAVLDVPISREIYEGKCPAPLVTCHDGPSCDRQVRAGDSVVHLSGIEQSLLYLLASRSGRVVTREEILDAIWGVDFVAESNIVDRHIRSLRIKLQNDYRHPRFIATVPGEGYRFIPTFSNLGWQGEAPTVTHASR